MKTPERDIMPLFKDDDGFLYHQGKEQECFRQGLFPTTAARWKRKNRIAQLKRTIARLEAENFELEYLSTRITYDGTMSAMLTF